MGSFSGGKYDEGEMNILELFPLTSHTSYDQVSVKRARHRYDANKSNELHWAWCEIEDQLSPVFITPSVRDISQMAESILSSLCSMTRRCYTAR